MRFGYPQPTMRILVDGIEQIRACYWDLINRQPDDISRQRWVPFLRDNEHLRETVDGYMEIITFPLDSAGQGT